MRGNLKLFELKNRYLQEVIMTEREKMLAGQLYDCGDAELLTQWHKAKDFIQIIIKLILQMLQKKKKF